MKLASRLISAALMTCALPLLADDPPYVPTDEERARWTMHDLRSMKIAVEAYKSDHKEYPNASALDDLLTALRPYIKSAIRTDAWGRALVYETTSDGFRLVSPGADGKFDRGSWLQPGADLPYDADAVVNDKAKFWFRGWR